MIETLMRHWNWFAACFGIYFVYGCMVYVDAIKRSPYYLYVGLTIAFIGNLIWLHCAKRPINPTEMLYTGLIWDLVIMFSFMGAGLLFGAVHLSWTTLLGFILLFAGSILLKL